jgi:hypothetical protein
LKPHLCQTETKTARRDGNGETMTRCSACGGVLGRDCFNEQDCLAISNSLESENNCEDKAVIALKEAKETIEWAMKELDCKEHLVETWGNLYLHALSLIDDALISKGALTVELPKHPDDLPF